MLAKFLTIGKDFMLAGTACDRVGEDGGFIRLTTEEVRENIVDAIARVVFDSARIVLHQAGKEVTANISAPTPDYHNVNC